MCDMFGGRRFCFFIQLMQSEISASLVSPRFTLIYGPRPPSPFPGSTNGKPTITKDVTLKRIRSLVTVTNTKPSATLVTVHISTNLYIIFTFHQFLTY